jgi:GAF domain-containing protein
MLHGAPREVEVQSNDGRWFLRAIRPYHDETATTGVAVTFTEITARKRAEEALRESRTQLALELEDTKKLQQISGLLIEQEHSDDLYEQILHAAMAIMRADFGSIQLLKADRSALRLLAWRNFHPDSTAFWQKIPLETCTTCGSALRHGERVIVPDVRTSSLLQNSEHLPYYALSGIIAVQSTPLTTREGRLIGMISTHWREVHTPQERELRFLDILAREAADVLKPGSPRKHCASANSA